MTQTVDKKLKLMCDCCKSHFDKPCAWLSLGNEYCTEIMEIQKKLEKLKEERKTLYKYTPEKGFELVGNEDVKD